MNKYTKAAIRAMAMFLLVPGLVMLIGWVQLGFSAIEAVTGIRGWVWLLVKWLFPAGEKHRDGEWMTEKPDTENLNKALVDCMTQLGFWADDAQVVSEIIEKFWAKIPGIYIRVDILQEEQ